TPSDPGLVTFGSSSGGPAVPVLPAPPPRGTAPSAPCCTGGFPWAGGASLPSLPPPSGASPEASAPSVGLSAPDPDLPLKVWSSPCACHLGPPPRSPSPPEPLWSAGPASGAPRCTGLPLSGAP